MAAAILADEAAVTARSLEESTYTVEVGRVLIRRKKGEIHNRQRDCETWRDENLRFHRVNGPAVTEYDLETGNVVYEIWARHGQIHRDDGPAMVDRDAHTGRITWSQWWQNGKPVSHPNRPGKSVERSPVRLEF
jgi:hypothetical protein